MFPPELVELIKHLLTSKEVIGVTIALILFFSLVFYVARTHHPRRKSSLVLPLKRSKKAKAEKVSASDFTDEDDELGLEDG
jgi:hypothetical protein